jgi:hypothetical protein
LKTIDKGQFKEMLDTLFDIYNRRHADQNLLRVWWYKLEKYPIEIISKSFDIWTSSSNKCPTPYDIILICRNKSQEVLAAKQPKIENLISKPIPKELKLKMEKILNKFRSRA